MTIIDELITRLKSADATSAYTSTEAAEALRSQQKWNDELEAKLSAIAKEYHDAPLADAHITLTRIAAILNTMKDALASTKRQYYYKVDGCRANDANSHDCICWHNEGTGALSDGSASTWRDAPVQQPEHSHECQHGKPFDNANDPIAALEAPCPVCDAPVTMEEALEALGNMSDYAQMPTSIDPIGARETLIQFIEQQPSAQVSDEWNRALLAVIKCIEDSDDKLMGELHIERIQSMLNQQEG